MNRQLLISALLTLFVLVSSYSVTGQEPLPDPDGRSADMTQKVKVFIIMGQSNTLEMGKVKGDQEGSLEYATKTEKLYPYMVDESGDWTIRKDVRNLHVMGSGGLGKSRLMRNDWLTVSGGKIGIEIGIGHHLGNALEEPVLILKSSIGNRALGWDLLPPGSEGFEFTDSKGVTWVHPGYKGSPEKWKKGEIPKKIGWYAGLQYEGDVARAKDVLHDLGNYYPGASEYEVAGFLWWQGDRDSRSEALSSRYEKNLAHLINTLRKDFNAPNAKFVCATLGQTKKDDMDNGGKLLNAMFSVADGEKYPDFKGNVDVVYTHPLSLGSSSGAHYGGNAKTYMNVGEAMGQAMVKMLKADNK